MEGYRPIITISPASPTSPKAKEYEASSERAHFLRSTSYVRRRGRVGKQRHSVATEPALTLLRGAKVLHVEDGDFLRLVTQKAVEKNDWIYTGANTGEEALEIFMDGQPFDVIFMDIHLGKGMSGYETAKKILEINPHQLIYSASSSEIEQDKQYLFKGNLGKVAGAKSLYESIATELTKVVLKFNFNK